MHINKLEELMSDYEQMRSLDTVNPGCDCGCGGDSMSDEDWYCIMSYGEAAQKELMELGVDFG